MSILASAFVSRFFGSLGVELVTFPPIDLSASTEVNGRTASTLMG